MSARKRFVEVQLGHKDPQPLPPLREWWMDAALFTMGVFVGVTGLASVTLLLVAWG